MMANHRARLLLAVGLLAAALIAAWWLRPHRPAAEPGAVVSVHFHRTGNPEGPPVPIERRMKQSRPSTVDLVRAGILALLAGPTAAEKAQGFFSSLPDGAGLIGARVERPYVYLNFSGALEETGGTARVKAILDELAYTAASVRGVKGVILAVDGEQAGTEEHPFTGEGALFRSLHPPVDGPWAARLAPADALDLFLVAIHEPGEMWRLMGPAARREYGSPAGIDVAAFAEGLGSWRNYRVLSEKIEGDRATVVIADRQVLEGQVEPDARYSATLVREEGRWKWELPGSQ